MQLQRAMAAEAEAAREARAKVIAAEGEMRASRALKEASDVISMSPAALQVFNVGLVTKGKLIISDNSIVLSETMTINFYFYYSVLLKACFTIFYDIFNLINQKQNYICIYFTHS